MKKTFILVMLSILLCSCIHENPNEQYVENDFVKCTQLLDSHKILKSEFIGNQVFIIARVTQRDRSRLLKRAEFLSFDTLNARWKGDQVNFSIYRLNDSFVYHMADYKVKGRVCQHPEKNDGYYIIGISKTKNEIIFCENFPELPLSPF